MGRHDLANLPVQHTWPDVVRRRQVERPRPRLVHQPWDQGVDLLGRDRAGAEDQRIALLPFVLFRIDVEGLGVIHHGALDRLARGTVDPTEHHIDVILLDEFARLGLRDAVARRTILEVQIDPSPKQAAVRVDVVNHHRGHVGVGDAHKRQRTGLVRDDADLDGTTRCRWFCHDSSPISIPMMNLRPVGR